MTDDLRQAIRTLLIEELAAQGVDVSAPAKPGVREETVNIQTDRDLALFVKRLLEMTKDNRMRADIDSGRHVFRLGRGSASTPSAHSRRGARAAGATVEFSTGLVTEKQIHNLPDGVSVVKVGKRARLTPLAGDAIRQAGINIERVKT